MSAVRTQYDLAPRTLRRIHLLQRISGLQVHQAELHRHEVSGVQRGRTGGEEGTQARHHLLWMLKLSQVRIPHSQKADPGEVSPVRPRVPGPEIYEGWAGDRVSEQEG